MSFKDGFITLDNVLVFSARIFCYFYKKSVVRNKKMLFFMRIQHFEKIKKAALPKKKNSFSVSWN